MPNFIITGGAGYIGKHLAYELVQDPDNMVYIIDMDLTKIPDSFRDHYSNIKLIHLDLTDKPETFSVIQELLEGIYAGPIIVYHLAGIAEARAPSLTIQIQKNLVTLKNTIDACGSVRKDNKCKVDQFVFASTSMIYYDIDNLYAKSKYNAEKYLKEKSIQYNLPACIYRIFNVTGEHWSHKIWEDHNPENHLIPNLFKLFLGFGEYVKLKLYATPVLPDKIEYLSPTRSYIDVMDVVSAFMHSNRNQIEKGTVPIWDVRTYKFHTILEVLQIIRNVSNREEDGVFLDIVEYDGTVQDAIAPYGSTILLNWKPIITLEESLINQWEGLYIRTAPMYH